MTPVTPGSIVYSFVVRLVSAPRKVSLDILVKVFRPTGDSRPVPAGSSLPNTKGFGHRINSGVRRKDFAGQKSAVDAVGKFEPIVRGQKKHAKRKNKCGGNGPAVDKPTKDERGRLRGGALKVETCRLDPAIRRPS